MTHPLDRPAWNALAGPQAGFAIGDGHARRFRAEIALFAAAKSPGFAGLDALVSSGERIGLVEREPITIPSGWARINQAPCVQMLAEQVPATPAPEGMRELGEADAPEMRALAELTRPGPFFAETWRFGGFVGLGAAGALVAMAGQRMHVAGFTEVSGVCTHPDHRGHGHAAALLTLVARRILARGEVPFLHSYADNHGAIALYERLGFRTRAIVHFAIVERL